MNYDWTGGGTYIELLHPTTFSYYAVSKSNRFQSKPWKMYRAWMFENPLYFKTRGEALDYCENDLASYYEGS